MKRALALALAALVAWPGPVARAQDTRGKRLAIKSEVLGEDRVALIRTPAGYDGSGQRLPVLYMTDGADQLGHTASTIEFLARNDWMPEMIVVAIVNTDRARDLTPTRAPLDTDDKGPPVGGGADRFLKFIETELIPRVEKTYRTAPYRIFAGHSLGGLLAVHAFATRNELFNTYIAVSPSLWWDNQLVIRETEELLKGRKALDRTLFVTLGNEEGRMRSGFEKLKAVFGQHRVKGFTWDAMLMEDEHHGSVVLRSHYFGLKKTFDGWSAGPQITAAGVQAVEEHFQKLSARYGYTIVPPEWMINRAGYQLLGNGKNGEAIAVFRSNAERYPHSPNVYDSLAEAYEKAGKLELARSNYERAVQLGTRNDDPNLSHYRTNLDRVSKALIKAGKTPDK
jgi:predicted alpha/beta superfamily hydrolase